jgi:hypothetical protein
MGLLSLLTELLFGLVLVSAVARRVFPALVLSMHAGILFVQNIFFPDLIAIQAVFYDWRAGAAWVRRTWTAPARSLRRDASRAAAFLRGLGGRVPGSRADAPPVPREGFALRPAERRIALVAAVFVVASFGNWAARTEKVPFTAWQMFSGWHEPGPVEHVRPMVVYEDGTRERARFERWIWAVADGRFRWLLTGWDRRPERVDQLRGFLDACALVANRDAPPGRRVSRFEIEIREWDYLRHPAGPENARLLRVLHHPVALAPAPVAAAAEPELSGK